NSNLQRSALVANVQLGFGISVFFACLILNVCKRCSLAVFHLFQVNVVFLFGFMTYSSDLFSFGPAMYTILLPGPVRRFLVHKIT
ncbi:hypothetical protein PENTCL1PPCAC_25884, partial [Pristionchus entomophagus]